MFSLFTSRKDSPIEIVKPGPGLTKRMGDLIGLRQSRLDDLGDSHGDVDMRLVENIGYLLNPMLGPEGCDDQSRWFHLMDYYGNGVRHLEFKPGNFPMRAIPELQALLVGEHEPFCILCWAPLEGRSTLEHSEGLAIFSDKMLLTAKLAAASTVVRTQSSGTDV